jgi:transcription initiation factor TFIIF subunit beta
MATLQGSGIPRVKLESVPDANIKPEPMEDTPSPYVDEDEEMYDEDNADLDFSQAQQQLWLSHIPKTLWEVLSKLQDDDEIEIGTIRVEGSETNPSRVSMLLKPRPEFANEPKEYNLHRPPTEKLRVRRPGQAFVFSEKDLAGYKPRAFAWDDIDEEGNPGQGRSFLYERHKREVKKKENKGRFVPYSRRPIPKQTAIAGTVAREFEAVPVKNEEYLVLENNKASQMLKPPERDTAVFDPKRDPSRQHVPLMSMSDRANAIKNAQARKQAQKENRAARVDKHVLIDKLLELFRQHRIWGLRDLKAKVNQPEAYLRQTLDEVAFMWKAGDFNGKWELKDEYKSDPALQNPMGVVAPKVEDSDMDKSGLDDDDDVDEPFEDVGA